MGKSKRNCRRTEDEVLIHEKAVKMRKMTDEQLVKRLYSFLLIRGYGFNNLRIEGLFKADCEQRRTNLGLLQG